MKPLAKSMIFAMFLILPLLLAAGVRAEEKSLSTEQFLAQLGAASPSCDAEGSVVIEPFPGPVLPAGCSCSVGVDNQGNTCSCNASGAGASCTSSGQGARKKCTCTDAGGTLVCKLVDGSCVCD